MELSEFREVLEAGWRQLDEAVDGLDEAAVLAPGVVGQWSAKDLLGHVAAWEQVALRLLDQFRAGGPLSGVAGAQVDAYNAAESERRAALPLAAVRAELADTRRRLREHLAALSEEEWRAAVGVERPGTLGAWVGGSLGGPLGPGTHPAEHAHHLLVWRVRRSSDVQNG